MIKDVFIDLVNMSITAGWLILAVMVLRLIFRRAPRWVFCLLWGFVGLRLVLPFSLESVFSLIPSKTPVNEVKNAVGRIVLNTAGTPVTLPSGGAAVNTPPVTAVPDVGAVAPSVTLPAAKETLSLTEIFALVWICGLLALLVYAAVSYLLLRYKIRTATRLESNVWQSEAVSSPFVLGFIKPRIYLPYALDALDIPYVLSHERAHISRRDHLIKPLGFMILAVYWFNPVIWLAYVLLCRDVELACDEKVIKTLGKDERRDYSTALLNCSVSRVRIAACPIAFGEVAVKERIKGVMNYKKPAFWIIILAVIAIIVTAVCFLTDPKDKEKEDDGVKEGEKEKNEEVLLEAIDLFNISYESESEDIEVELVNESIAKIAPMAELDFVNQSQQTVYLPTNYTMYYNDGGGWAECEGGADGFLKEKAQIPAGDRVRLIRDLSGFDMTKPGQYCLWQEFYYESFTAEAETLYTRVYFEISEGVINPIDDGELVDTDLQSYVYWMTEYMRIPSLKNEDYYMVNGLYLAARYSYENDMPFVTTDKKYIRIPRADMCAIYSALTGEDKNVGALLDKCHQYLETFGDSYDYDKEEYLFSVKRDGWGENKFLDNEYRYDFDPQNAPQISEDYNDVTVTVWIKHPRDDKNFYKANFAFEKTEIYGRIVYKIKDIYYLESPEDKEIEVAVTGLKQDTQTGHFTEFLLKAGNRETVFKGKASADYYNLPRIAYISQNDNTGDGVKDISVIFRTDEYDPDYPSEIGCEEIHVFDGVTLEEIPGLKNLPQRIQDTLELSCDGEVYTIGLNGKEYHVKKKWYGDTSSSNFYDLPSFTEFCCVSDHGQNINYTLICTVNGTAERYDDNLWLNMVYQNGEFVLDRIEVSGFFYYGDECEVHNGYYHSYGSDHLIDYYMAEEFWREYDAYGYDNDGCKCIFNKVNMAKHFGITGRQLRDSYYKYDYYTMGFDPLPLFDLDEEACDEFFRAHREETPEQNETRDKRRTEYSFKLELLEMIHYSKDPVERAAFYKLTNNEWWSIPELVYEAEMSLEEIRQIYTEYTENIDVYFEYDFERLFSDREYFEDLIETAEYPVFVDEALRK